MDFGTILREAAARHANSIAVTCEDRSQRYDELYARACRLANGLGSLGVGKGDRVALLGPNGFHTPEQIAGVALGGFVRAGLYAHETGAVNAYLLDLVEAAALIVHADALPQLRPALDDVGWKGHVIVYGGDDSDAIAYEQLLEAQPQEDPMVVQAPDDVHVVRFSAGTTGRPKGIVHTVAGWLAIGDQYRWVTPMLDERDVYLAAGQLTHAAVVFFWPFLQVGGRIVVMPAFDAGRFLELVEEHRASFTLVVPTMIQAIVDHPSAGARDLSSLRCVNYAASPIAFATLTRAVALFGDTLFHMYAQSELPPITMLLPHEHRPLGDDAEQRRTRSVGRPTPNTVVTVVDDEGVPLPAGEIGEIAGRSPSQMLGLWKDPEGTAARTLPDGSILTRDMGYLDDEGFLHLADRKDDMIISGGHNIWPAQIEDALADHPAVAEVCVIGIPHERWGETPIAAVVLRDGASVTEEELIELTRARVGSVKKVTKVEFVESLPKSGIGKILRREVRERYWTTDDGLRVSGA
jgi:acyl-CoA synthetase (AMP-forming)/AMP-acid ligase II